MIIKKVLGNNGFCRRGLSYSMFEVIFGFLTIEEGQQGFSRVCKTWRSFHLKQFQSYSSLSMKSLDTATLSWKELQVILDRGETLQHVRQVGDLIRRDFRGQVKFFHQNISLQARVADRLYSTKEVVTPGATDSVKVIP